MQQTDQSFKYVIQTFSDVYFGGRLTYEELENADDAPLQLKKIINRVIRNEVPKTTMIEDHLMTLTEGTDSFTMYEQMKIKIEVDFFDVVKENAKGKKEHKSKSYTIKELVNAKELHGESRNFVIREIQLKKLRLSFVTV